MRGNGQNHTHLSQPLTELVNRMMGKGLYETPDEYVRDLIRRDMELRGGLVQDAILSGYRDTAEDRMFESAGDFKADMALLDRKEVQDWH